MENNWKINTLRVKVKKYDVDPKWHESGNENYVEKMFEDNKNTYEYRYNLLKQWGYDIWM